MGEATKWREHSRFHSQEELEAESSFLSENGIRFKIEDISLSFDAAFSNNELTKEYIVKIHIDDKKRLEKLYANKADQENLEIDPDHYLLTFSDEELIDVIKHRDEWNENDYFTSLLILKRKGKEFSEEEIKGFEEERLREMAEPEKGEIDYIIMGYVFSVTGGLLGIAMGLHYWRYKKDLPNGDRVTYFDDRTRRHGMNMIKISVASFTVIVLALLIFITLTSIR